MAGKKKAAGNKPARVRRKPSSRRSTPTREAERPMAVTTFRVYRDQLVALQRQALDRKAEGGGRADASLILRELLDRELGSR